jgi:hypothetical protein
MNSNDQKPDNFGGPQDSQFGGSGFGNSTFGGQGNAAFNANSSFGAPANSKFGGPSEFGSGNFGGNSSVSQIFKEGGFGEEDKRKKMMVLGAALVSLAIVGGAVYYFFIAPQDAGFDTAFTEAPALPTAEFSDSATEATPADAAGETAADEGGELADDEVSLPPDESLGAAPAATSGSGAAVAQPVGGNVSSWTYDEAKGGPVVNVTDGAVVEVSQSANFASLYVFGRATGGAFRIPNPPPGSIYWREQGSGQVNEIKVAPPPSLGISFSAPSTLTPGASLSWEAERSASYYRVEFATDAGFTDIAAAVSTTSNQAAINGLNPGSYYIRVGGLNTASGKFEYSASSRISMQ